LIAESFIGGDSVTLVLGDNVFLWRRFVSSRVRRVQNRARPFSVITLTTGTLRRGGIDAQGQAIFHRGKAKAGPEQLRRAGALVYDNHVVATKTLKPSAGELEITDVNVAYLRRGQLRVNRLSEDSRAGRGTSSSLHEAFGLRADD